MKYSIMTLTQRMMALHLASLKWIATTSGFDTVSGSLLGVGLLATSRRSFSGDLTRVTEPRTPFDHRTSVGLAR